MKKTDIQIDHNVFNSVYLPYLDDTTRTQIFFGGASSGKSVFVVAQRTAYDLLRGNRNYLIVRNTATSTKKSTFNEINKIIDKWGVRKYFKVNKSEMTITCRNGYQILFGGLDDVEKLKSISPIKSVLTDILVEEATECQEQDIRQLGKRLRGSAKVKKRVTMLFNPILRSHWIWAKYFKGKFQDGDTTYRDKKLSILKTTYKDNRFLEVDDIAELEDETDKYSYNVYTLGNWGTLGDVIFTNWSVADLTEQARHFDSYRYGLDFGFSSHPAAFNEIHYDRKRKIIYITDEVHEYGLTNQELAAKIRPVLRGGMVVCDSAEPKSIAELNISGIYAVKAEKGKDSKNFGIQWLQQNEIVIDRQCKETINEFQLYQWAKNRAGETLDKPVDRNDHHIDEIRYALESDMEWANYPIQHKGTGRKRHYSSTKNF